MGKDTDVIQLTPRTVSNELTATQADKKTRQIKISIDKLTMLLVLTASRLKLSSSQDA